MDEDHPPSRLSISATRAQPILKAWRVAPLSNRSFFKAPKTSFKRNLAETYQLLRRDRYDRTNVRHLIGMTDRI